MRGICVPQDAQNFDSVTANRPFDEIVKPFCLDSPDFAIYLYLSRKAVRTPAAGIARITQHPTARPTFFCLPERVSGMPFGGTGGPSLRTIRSLASKRMKPRNTSSFAHFFSPEHLARPASDPGTRSVANMPRERCRYRAITPTRSGRCSRQGRRPFSGLATLRQPGCARALEQPTARKYSRNPGLARYAAR